MHLIVICMHIVCSYRLCTYNYVFCIIGNTDDGSTSGDFFDDTIGNEDTN